jgi:hypothetical protein
MSVPPPEQHTKQSHDASPSKPHAAIGFAVALAGILIYTGLLIYCFLISPREKVTYHDGLREVHLRKVDQVKQKFNGKAPAAPKKQQYFS